METRTYDLNSYKLHILKNNKMKTCTMQIDFRDKVLNSNLQAKTMLSDIITDCSKDYENRKDITIALEDLYRPAFYGSTIRTGAVVTDIFNYSFIAPKYINEDSYYEEVLKFPFDMILNPKVINKEFEITSFNVIKERTKRDILSLENDPVKTSIQRASIAMDLESLCAKTLLGTEEELEEMTPIKLYEEYKKMINESFCDIFIIGDVDFDETYKIVKKHFKLNTIKAKRLEYSVTNKSVKKPTIKSDDSLFVQSSLIMIYNLEDLTKHEKDVVLQMYNFILGSGGMSSKLYQKVREENSLCYGVYSLFLKHDNLLMIQVSLDEENREKAIKLTKECIKEMEKGEITEEIFEHAKMNLLASLKMRLDNNSAILNNYIFSVYDNLPSIEERMEATKNLELKEIKEIAKKIKLNTIYTLKGGENK